MLHVKLLHVLKLIMNACKLVKNYTESSYVAAAWRLYIYFNPNLWLTLSPNQCSKIRLSALWLPLVHSQGLNISGEISYHHPLYIEN